MKNKGFTLVEMLGVMTLLAVIFALVYPNIMNMMEKGKENEYKEYESNVFLATEAYVNASAEKSALLVTEGNTLEVTYLELLQSGYLSSNIVDPDTDKSVSDLTTNKVIVTVAKDKTFTYSIQGGE